MTDNLTCPACKATDLDVCKYDSMMVLRKDTVHAIPAQLREEIRFAAIEVGAGMGAGE